MNINNPNYKDNLNYDNSLTYKDNLNYNNSNSILNSKSLISNSNNNSTPNPQPLPLMFTLLNSHFAERQATDCKQAQSGRDVGLPNITSLSSHEVRVEQSESQACIGSASCFLLVSLASALRQTFASLTGDVMQAYIPLPLCFKGEGECTPVENSNISINPPVSKADIPPYEGGRGEKPTSLTKFNCKSSILNSSSLILNFSNSAFSLIELSIVLIIIGLLIAGVTGGASLIQSAKVRSLINEIKDYERAVYTFQAAKGRYPGDVKDYGTFGSWSNYDNPTSTSSSYARPGYAYKATDFPSEFLAEFQKTAGAGVVPNQDSAPFVELYNEGIIDFKPLGNALTASKDSTKRGTLILKSDPGAYGYFMHDGTHQLFRNTPCAIGINGCDFVSGMSYVGNIKEVIFFKSQDETPTKSFGPKFLKAVDEKMDDGWYSTGIFRGGCYGSNHNNGYNSYDNAMENGKKCSKFYYAL